MVEFRVKINSIDEVKKFVGIVAKYEFDVDIISDKYSVNAKSVMGIFSIDLSNELVMKAHTNDEETVKADLTDYIVA